MDRDDCLDVDAEVDWLVTGSFEVEGAVVGGSFDVDGCDDEGALVDGSLEVDGGLDVGVLEVAEVAEVGVLVGVVVRGVVVVGTVVGVTVGVGVGVVVGVGSAVGVGVLVGLGVADREGEGVGVRLGDGVARGTPGPSVRDGPVVRGDGAGRLVDESPPSSVMATAATVVGTTGPGRTGRLATVTAVEGAPTVAPMPVSGAPPAPAAAPARGSAMPNAETSSASAVMTTGCSWPAPSCRLTAAVRATASAPPTPSRTGGRSRTMRGARW